MDISVSHNSGSEELQAAEAAKDEAMTRLQYEKNKLNLLQNPTKQILSSMKELPKEIENTKEEIRKLQGKWLEKSDEFDRIKAAQRERVLYSDPETETARRTRVKERRAELDKERALERAQDPILDMPGFKQAPREDEQAYMKEKFKEYIQKGERQLLKKINKGIIKENSKEYNNKINELNMLREKYTSTFGTTYPD